jgi:hypothetical protein
MYIRIRILALIAPYRAVQAEKTEGLDLLPKIAHVRAEKTDNLGMLPKNAQLSQVKRVTPTSRGRNSKETWLKGRSKHLVCTPGLTPCFDTLPCSYHVPLSASVPFGQRNKLKQTHVSSTHTCHLFCECLYGGKQIRYPLLDNLQADSPLARHSPKIVEGTKLCG